MYVANVCICFKNFRKKKSASKKQKRSFLLSCTCFCVFRPFLFFDSQFDITHIAKAKLILTFSVSVRNRYAFAHANTHIHRKEFILYDLKNNTYFSTLCISALFFPAETYRILFLSQILVCCYCIFNKIAW